MLGWQDAARRQKEERDTWIKLGAADERESLLDILRTWKVGSLKDVIALLDQRQRDSGVQVRRCTAGDMEPDGKEVPPEQT